MKRPAISRSLLQCGFHLLYNQLAFSYDLVADLVSFGQWPAWRRHVIPLLIEGSTLDLAFGTGGLLADLHARGREQVVGIDLSPFMGRIAGRRLRQRGCLLRLVQGQAQQLPFGNQTFANVIATFPAEFILSPGTVLSVARVLRPGGCLLIVVKGCLKGPVGLRQLIRWAYQATGQTSWQENSLVTRLNAGGFQVEWVPVSAEGAASLLVVARRT